MKEIILEINEYEDDSREGWIIKTNKQEISFLINNIGQCCEQFGHIASVDDTSEFIGSELYQVNLVDSALNLKTNITNEECEAIFFNFETNKGTLQFTCYNCHNGYYGHYVYYKSNTEDLSFYI